MDAVNHLIRSVCDLDKNDILTREELGGEECQHHQKIFFDSHYIENTTAFAYIDSNKNGEIDIHEAAEAFKIHLDHKQNYFMFFVGEYGKCFFQKIHWPK